MRNNKAGSAEKSSRILQLNFTKQTQDGIFFLQLLIPDLNLFETPGQYKPLGQLKCKMRKKKSVKLLLSKPKLKFSDLNSEID